MRAPRPSRRRGGWRCHVVGLPATRPGRARGARRARASARPTRRSKASSRAPASPRSTRRRSRRTRRRATFYVAAIERPGRPTPEVFAEILPAIIRAFPWPKSMRWGAASAREPRARLRWVRPLHAIVCTFGPETEAPEVVRLRGRRHPLRRPDARPPLHGAGADPGAPLRRLRRGARAGEGRARRRPPQGHHPRRRAQNLAFARGLELVEDEALLEEVAGLVEWPVVLMGAFDEAFLDDPARGHPRDDPREPEVLRAARKPLPRGDGRARRRRVRVRGALHPQRASPSPGRLRRLDLSLRERWARSRTASSSSPTSRRSDGGTAIVAGNERVVRRRRRATSGRRTFFCRDASREASGSTRTAD